MGCNASRKTSLAPPSCSNQLAGSAYPMKSSFSVDRVWGGSQSGIRNHRFGVNDCKNQRIYPYHIRHIRINMAEMGDHRTVRLDGRVSVGKCYPGLRPNANISKQRQYMRMYYPNTSKLWSGFHDHALEGRANLMDSGLHKETSSFNVQYSNEKFRVQGGLVPQYENSNPEYSHSACHGTFSVVGDQSVLSCNLMECPSPIMRAMDTQEDLLTGPKRENCEVPNQTIYKNFNGVPINCEDISCDLEKGCILDQQTAANLSGFPNNRGCGNGTELGCHSKFPDAQEGINLSSNYNNGTHTLQGGVASSVDIPLHNLSLSSSKEAEPSTLSSIASSVVSEALLNPQLKPLDLMDEGQFSTGQQVHESNGVASDPSPQNASKLGKYRNASKLGKDDVLEEEIQKDPPTDLSIEEKADTKELQTIKNFDVEYIKELGSGTYGTVFFGKWKGSDVAIKRLKPSCFTEGAVEDRLVADFWREAHILGQLHHPNIVALYGVVTDSPVTNLATVTEYMVNGSLRQVLRKRDRTIDRRKRLIIAMDAAVGMEYLHEKNIVHFDLKSHNFLVNIRDPQRPVCKIGDLGLSKIKQKTLVSGGVRGTIPWMAPELLNSKNNMVTEKVDVYSFGIVMWELLIGEEPYGNLRSEEIIAGIIKGNLRPEIPSWCDPAWRSLMEKCWSSDPDYRPAFSEIAKELFAMSAAMNIK